MSPKRDLNLHLTEKGMAVIRPQPQKHGFDDITVMIYCKCGACFDGNGGTDHAWAQLDAHLQETNDPTF